MLLWDGFCDICHFEHFRCTILFTYAGFHFLLLVVGMIIKLLGYWIGGFWLLIVVSNLFILPTAYFVMIGVLIIVGYYMPNYWQNCEKPACP